MNDSDALIGGEAISADSIGLEKKSFFNKKNKKFFIIGGIVIILLIITIVIIIIVTNKNNSDKKEDSKDEDEHEPKNAIGEINAEYYITSTTSPTNILSSDFNGGSSLSIYIDDKFVNFTKQYIFNSTNQKVRFIIFDEINMNKMFKGVKELKIIDINSKKNMKIKSLESAFEDCERLIKFRMSGCELSSIVSVKNIFKNTKIKDINEAISSFNNVKDISYLFAGMKLDSLNLSNFKTEEVVNMSGLFKDSQFLTSLDLTNFNTRNVIDISKMFEGCFSLERIIFSNNFSTNKVTNMSSLFAECTSLIKIDTSFFNTANVVDMSSMFKNCKNIDALDLTSFETNKLKNMKSMFESCTKLKSLSYSDKFGFNNVTDTSYMFKELKLLKKLELSNFEAPYLENMQGMFQGMNSITELDLTALKPNNLKYIDHAFDSCFELYLLNFPNLRTD